MRFTDNFQVKAMELIRIAGGWAVHSGNLGTARRSKTEAVLAMVRALNGDITGKDQSEPFELTAPGYHPFLSDQIADSIPTDGHPRNPIQEGS
jgi:hypothetical protein